MPFYKKDLREIKSVYSPEFTLTEENKDLFIFPYQGFVWAENQEKAGKAWGMTIEETQQAIQKLISPQDEHLISRKRIR